MKRKITLLILFFLIILTISIVGCGGSKKGHGPTITYNSGYLGEINDSDPGYGYSGDTALVTGVITDGRSGPVLEGVTVKAYTTQGYTGISTTTGADGSYSLNIPAGKGVDLIASKNGYARTRFQDLNIAVGATSTANMVIKKVFNSNWSLTPPVANFTGIAPGITIAGNINITVSLTLGQDPKNGNLYWAPGVEETVLSPNSGTYPFVITASSQGMINGSNFFYFAAYDMNNNCVINRIPVIIQNGSSGSGSLTMTAPIYLEARTYGDDMQFDSLNKGLNPSNYDQSINDLNTWKSKNHILSAETNSACYVFLQWSYDEFYYSSNIKGYKVYRSSSPSGPWISLGYAFYSSSGYAVAFDLTSDVTPIVASYYKVVPVSTNDVEGNGQTNSVTPLGRFQVDLVSPANNAIGVSLTPTFIWNNNVVSGADQYSYKFYVRSLSSSSYGSYTHYTTNPTNNSYTYSSSWGLNLQNNQKYQWDIESATASKTYSGNSIAYSYAIKAGSDGSYNGGFVFTTIP